MVNKTATATNNAKRSSFSFLFVSERESINSSEEVMISSLGDLIVIEVILIPLWDREREVFPLNPYYNIVWSENKPMTAY